jgi:hypothetical protein
MEAKSRPRLLSPDIDLELMHITPELPIASIQYSPKVGVY